MALEQERAVKVYKPSVEEKRAVEEITRRWDEAQGHHADFMRRYERGERAYLGILRSSDDAAKWKHKHAPKFAFNLLETIVSNTVEQGLRMNVRPAPQLNTSLDEAMQMLDQAEVVGDLLRHEERVDEMEHKQRPLFLSDALCGRGIAKNYWRWETGERRKQGVNMVDVLDPEGNPIMQVPQVGEVREDAVIRDHSTLEVIDPRDFVLNEAARGLDPREPGGAQHLFQRSYLSYEQLKMMERAGYLKNVDKLGESRDFTEAYSERESTLFEKNRTKNLIEVWEYWCFKGGQVYRTIIGNRLILLREEEASPFAHGAYPFSMVSSQPYPFALGGMAAIELVAELQAMAWELGNQTLDNIELINNFITLIRSDVDDPGSFKPYPGAQWFVDDPQQVEPLQPPYQLAEVAMHQMALIKGDMQNVTSAAPFASGAETATVDQKTATGASIVMNAAQQQLQARKYEAQRGLKQAAWQRIKNCQQFITDQRLAHIVGPDGQMAFREIDPLQIQGEFVTELEPMGESQMRQERRAEATQFGQFLMQVAPLAAASGTPLNVQEILTWVAKRWDIEDYMRFFSQQPQAMGAMMGMQGQGGGGGAGAPIGANQPSQDVQGNMQPNLGVTAGEAVDAGSPSAAGGMSMSPVMAFQRALAMSG